MTDIFGHADPFADYLDEDGMAQARKVSKRTLRKERQLGCGPPFLRIDRRVLYPVAGFRAYLERITTQPVRARG
jgi:hypothetical protein